jgi:NitT/TauT family transport system permease protein
MSANAASLPLDDAALPRERPVWLLRLVAIAILLGGWQILGIVLQSTWIPPFSAVIERIGSLFATGEVQPALAASISTLVVAFALSVVVAVAVGTAMATSSVVEDALRIYVEVGLSTPHIVFAPIFFAFFGFSGWTLIAVVFIFCVFHMIVTTQTAIEAADPRLRDMAVSFGASRMRVFTAVTLRAAAPMILAGLRVGLGRAVKGLVVGELFVTVVGLGALERQYSSAFDGPGMWAVAVTVISLAVLLTSLVQVVDRQINAWMRV